MPLERIAIAVGAVHRCVAAAATLARACVCESSAGLLDVVMSLAALYEASVLSALTDILSCIQPPSVTAQPAAAAQQRSGGSSDAQQRPVAPLVSVRWPDLPASRQQLIDALTLHDLLVLLIHAAVLQHGATPVAPQPSEQPTVAGHFASPPSGWNSSRGGYRLRYTFRAPLGHTSAPSTADTSGADVLPAESSIVCELRLLLLPMSHYLVIDAAVQQQQHDQQHLAVAVADGASGAGSTNHKLALDVLNYVSVDELHGCLARWQDELRGQQQLTAAASGEQATDDSTQLRLRLSAWVYRDVALLLSAVSNAIIKRCMGPLSALPSIHPSIRPTLRRTSELLLLSTADEWQRSVRFAAPFAECSRRPSV